MLTDARPEQHGQGLRRYRRVPETGRRGAQSGSNESSSNCVTTRQPLSARPIKNVGMNAEEALPSQNETETARLRT